MTQGCRALPTSEIAACIAAGSQALEAEENKEAAAAQQKAREEADRPIHLFVRDSISSMSRFDGPSLGEKGASLSALRSDGADATQAKVAVFGVLNAALGGRLQPFFGASWLRDGAAAPKKDIRQVSIGASGPLLQSEGPGYQAFTLLSTFQLSRRSDLYAFTDGTVARAHFDLSWGQLASGDALGGVGVLPHIAVLWHQRSRAGPEEGIWRSIYAGLTLAKPFELGQERFRASLIARKIFDTSVPNANRKRRSSYVNLSLDYYLYDPENKTAVFQPSLFIAREAGTDFLEYGGKVNRTSAGVRLKFN